MSRIWYAIALLMSLLSPAESVAQTAIDGTWSGSGQVQLASGEQERVRCRATFATESRTRLVMRARCASSSFTVAQTAELRRQSDSHYSGSFFNQEYGISGQILLQVTGNTLVASLRADGGSAQFRLSR